MTRTLTVTVAGTTNTGKTLASLIIERALRDHGFEVELKPNLDGDQDSKRAALAEGKAFRVEGISVEIHEVRLNRAGFLLRTEVVHLEEPSVKWNDFIYDPRLPKANLIWLKWHWFWFRSLWDKVLGRQPRLPWKLLFWLPWRMANAWAVYIGPVQIGWRRPWLAGPAGHELERLDRIEALNC